MDVSIGSKLKELVSHGFVYGLTSSLQNVLGFLLLPILTIYFTPAEFGIYSIILLVSALASAIFYFGANSALGRFYYEEDNDEYRKSIFSTTLLITGCGAALLIILSLLLNEWLSIKLFQTPMYALPIKLSLIGTSFGFLLNPMTVILRYEKRSWMFMGVILAGVLLNFSITYILLDQYQYGLLAPIYGTLFSSSFSFLFLFIQNIQKLSRKVYKSLVQQFLAYGLQASAISLFFYLIDWVDRLIIKDLLPMADVGIYSLGYRLGAVINVLLIMPFGLIWAPIRMQYAKSDNNKAFVAKAVSYFSMSGIALVFLTLLFGKNLMDFIFRNRDYADASKLLPIIMFSFLIYGFQSIVDFGIYLHKKIYFYILISAVGLVFNVIMNYWLIPHFGYMAAAYVTLLTYLLTTALLYFVSSRYYKLDIEWGRVIGPMLFTMFFYFILNFTTFLQSFGLIKKIIIIFLLIITFVKFWLKNDEKIYLNRFIERTFNN